MNVVNTDLTGCNSKGTKINMEVEIQKIKNVEWYLQGYEERENNARGNTDIMNHNYRVENAFYLSLRDHQIDEIE